MEEHSEAFSAPSITLNVKFGGESLQPVLPAIATVKDLKVQLQHFTDVLPRGQKLIFKGKILEDGLTLKAASLSDGSKIMLMASHGVHQGGGHVKKDALVSTNSTVSEVKLRQSSGIENSIGKSRLERWQATGIISLSASGLEVVPVDVWTIGDSARVLDIGNNCLQEVPTEISNLTNLQKLRLSANNLSDSGFKWQSLTSLKHLNILMLNQNQLTHLPVVIGMLTTLKQVNLADNKLENLPQEIGQLTKLEVLNMSNNRLRTLPLTIGDCCSLLEVDFSANCLQELPTTLGNLQNMKVLQLANNGLKTFPPRVLKGCSQLSTLNLHGNEITIDDLREVEGWVEFDERRKSKRNKQIEFSVMGPSGFDEGADAQQWDRW